MTTPSLDEATAHQIAADWHRGPGSALHHLATTGTLTCRTTALAETRAAIRDCAATAAMVGPDLVDSPDLLDDLLLQDTAAQTPRLHLLADWIRDHTGPCTAGPCHCPTVTATPGAAT